jgi:hypothetical protein
VKALVAGWFSFQQMGATAGDLLARDLACEWLEEAGYECDVAHAPPFSGGVDWRSVDPGDYSLVVFVCGPFGNSEMIAEFLDRFRLCRSAGLNLSMLQPLDVWNPFDLLLERDSSETSRPDISFLSRQELVPVVGAILVHPQEEYKGKAMHRAASEAVQRLLDYRELAAVSIDTRLDVNSDGLRTPAEVESLIARMDAVLTTRLHGTVLAIKNGVPPLVIDPIAGGAKVKRQADTIGWPSVFTVDSLTDQALRDALDYCLSEEARAKARECCDRAREIVRAVRQEFIAAYARTSGTVRR